MAEGLVRGIGPLLDTHRLERMRSEIARFGFGKLPDAIPKSELLAMQAEAAAILPYAKAMDSSGPGALAYRARVGTIGPCIAQFYESPLALGLVEELFGGRFELTRALSCITYYAEGDHLAPHRDDPPDECNVTILVYLEITRPERAVDKPSGLQLQIFGDESKPRSRPMHCIPTDTGLILVGRGSQVWHGRPELQSGESVTALTGCYRVSALG